MQFSKPFNALLASVILTVYVGDVLAIPISHRPDSWPETNLTRRAAPIFSMPITTVAYDAAFHVKMSIGENPRPFLLHLDSASSDFWVYSAKCPQRGSHNGVSTAESTTFKEVSKAILDVNYQDGDGATGAGGLDTLLFAGQKVATPALEFGVAEEVFGRFPELAEDGVLGLGPPGFDDEPFEPFDPDDEDEHLSPPFMQNLLAANVIPAKVTGWKLPRTKDVDSLGSLSFGGPDPAHFSAPFVTVKAAETNERNPVPWGISVDAVSIDGAVAISTPVRGFVDFGTTNIVMSITEADTLNEKIPGAEKVSPGQWDIPCTTQAVLALTIGGEVWPVDPRDLAYEPVEDSPGFCISNILGDGGVEDGRWILGGTFLKNVYTVLVEDSLEVGFAQPR
ncbi:hypothetical protein EVG20_g8341 [Dentipellis fragilis]|uniref:Peptidase A1 domain-containing protein n=1 Tax=Dentipellis fragilis TaxID=205917 RepID=A0A4Y9Y6X4_9AGAM|nr:hypothetical protein EVG20_g8341 [Dentipellis fragilis]